MYTYKAECVRVVDGDTMDFKVDVGFHMTACIRVRLADIDTPEIYGKDAKVEGELGKKVSAFVKEQLFEDEIVLPTRIIPQAFPVPVVIETQKTGSFGRWIATVTFADGQTLADKIRQAFPEIK